MTELPDYVHQKINRLINQPWARSGLHCWRLTREVIGLIGYELPVVIEYAPAGRVGREQKADWFNNHSERDKWQEVVRPTTWALALMHRPFRSAFMIEHSGVYFPEKGGMVLHTSDPHGVVFDSLSELKLRNWVPIYLVPRIADAGT